MDYDRIKSSLKTALQHSATRSIIRAILTLLQHHAINATDWSFTLAPDDIVWFTKVTNLEPNLLSILNLIDGQGPSQTKTQEARV
jgi:hypothetical protein